MLLLGFYNQQPLSSREAKAGNWETRLPDHAQELQPDQTRPDQTRPDYQTTRLLIRAPEWQPDQTTMISPPDQTSIIFDPEMQKRVDTADISVLFFCANILIFVYTQNS